MPWINNNVMIERSTLKINYSTAERSPSALSARSISTAIDRDIEL
jgi:hypothetical protein